MANFDKLQYISQGNTAEQQADNILKALHHGAKWIQLRWKNAPQDELKSLAEKVKKWCVQNEAIFIINDSANLAKDIDADGVHLGLTDSHIATARSLLGHDKIIGGTANTLDDVLQRIDEQCDYIGLGPFRFTTTKEKLSPVLGLKGYENINHFLKDSKIAAPPLYAIGGIETGDISMLKEVGVYGVALSGLITQQPGCIQRIKTILQ